MSGNRMTRRAVMNAGLNKDTKKKNLETFLGSALDGTINAVDTPSSDFNMTKFMEGQIALFSLIGTDTKRVMLRMGENLFRSRGAVGMINIAAGQNGRPAVSVKFATDMNNVGPDEMTESRFRCCLAYAYYTDVYSAAQYKSNSDLIKTNLHAKSGLQFADNLPSLKVSIVIGCRLSQIAGFPEFSIAAFLFAVYQNLNRVGFNIKGDFDTEEQVGKVLNVACKASNINAEQFFVEVRKEINDYKPIFASARPVSTGTGMFLQYRTQILEVAALLGMAAEATA